MTLHDFLEESDINCSTAKALSSKHLPLLSFLAPVDLIHDVVSLAQEVTSQSKQ